MLKRFVLVIIVGSTFVGCEGDLNFDDQDSNLRIKDPNGIFGDPTDPDNPIIIGENNDNDPFDPLVNPDADPFLEFASVGTRCLNGTNQTYLVLSDAPVSCADHAAAIDAADLGEDVPGLVVFDANAPTGSKTYCDTDGCRAIDFNIDFGGSGSGSWAGDDLVQTFDAQDCDYDTELPPPVVESPIRGLSITEVSFYQGVKIPVVENGQMVANRNAPIVAGRPGIVRAFIQPDADWVPREVVAILTLGEIEKEVRITPTAVSQETAGASTINFTLEQDELPNDATFSIKLLEAAQCADPPGTVGTWEMPAGGTPVDLGVEGLAKSMDIVLVPLRYNADGSGRMPTLGANEVQRYRDIVYQFYPVAEVNVTVANPIDYNNGLNPNGDGFGAVLNFCINQRANANVANDVYYYCLIQPTATAQQFCGGGCVAGVAPVPGANDVGNRAGMGIAFDGLGEDTFVHEIGHALGRPHSPCGGAAGADPAYPYNQGVIGSWGYSVISGDLVDPGVRDFMGYCEPTWVSDFTYDRIFTRLQSVLGTQAAFISTGPQRWRTAIIDTDGSLEWGDDRTMTQLPGGVSVNATLRDLNQNVMGTPEVYAVPVADIDAVLLTIEDIPFSGGELEIPGVGTLTL